VRFYTIRSTNVDFPHAIPPVRPIIRTFFSFLAIINIRRHGANVVRRAGISLKTVLAIKNFLNKNVYIEGERDQKDNDFRMNAIGIANSVVIYSKNAYRDE
jgi:hypothetical protein